MISYAEQDALPLIADSFALGSLLSVAFLPSGLMNVNWRVEGTCKAAAVKRVLDVKAGAATLSLAVIGYLADVGVPVPCRWARKPGRLSWRLKAARIALCRGWRALSPSAGAADPG
jgi:hypothetical protein